METGNMSQNHQEIKKLYQAKVFWLHFLISGSLFSAIILAVVISFSFPKTTKKNVIINGSALVFCGILNIIAIANLGNLETSSKKLKARIKLDAEILKDEWARQHLIDLNQSEQIETVLRHQINQYQEKIPQQVYQETPTGYPTESPTFEDYQPNYVEIPETEYQGFDWNKLQDTTNFPHISFESKTGGGKSTTSAWAAHVLGGYVIASALHYQPGDFPSVDLIACKGCFTSSDSSQDIADVSEINFTFRDLIEGKANPDAVQLLACLFEEMKLRYASGIPFEQHLPVTVILDEFNSYGFKKDVAQVAIGLLRQSRKVGIRLVFLCQGLEGLFPSGHKSSVESLTRIRLKEKAINYAESHLKTGSKTSPQYKRWASNLSILQSQNRPCLVDDEVAIIPDLSNWKVVNPNQKILPGASTNLNKTIAKPPVETIEYLIEQAEIEEDNIQFCNHQNIRKNGFTSTGKQRWLCSDCGQTTSGETPNYG
jgi:hypothetical protein